MTEKRHCISLRIEASFSNHEQIGMRLLPKMRGGGLSFRVSLICRQIKLRPNKWIPTFKYVMTAKVIGDSCVFANILNFHCSENLFENFSKNLS